MLSRKVRRKRQKLSCRAKDQKRGFYRETLQPGPLTKAECGQIRTSGLMRGEGDSEANMVCSP
jgi:hypothetical protein